MLDNLFKKDKKILSIFFTAGFPGLNDTGEILKILDKSDVDLIEVGVPFSDSLVDGPTIQVSNDKAISNGMNLAKLFSQLEEIKDEIKTPLIIMSSFNPILQYGLINFCKKCKEIGISGTILPDLPPEIFVENYKEIFDSYNLPNILLVSPQTSDERIKYIDSISNGFVYAVSSFATTGNSNEIEKYQLDYFDRLESLNLKNPLIVGFGIKDKETFDKCTEKTNGGIIGSAFIRSLSDSDNLEKNINKFLEKFK
ncbi:UNVERIFIED_CONTAM: hypothetical protein GTU68_066431 [Idotea baltica]|nr:hypothetical protein [Idotea baltica]